MTVVMRLVGVDLGLEPDAVTSDLLFPCSSSLAFHHGDPQGQESKIAAHGVPQHTVQAPLELQWACILGLAILLGTFTDLAYLLWVEDGSVLDCGLMASGWS